MSLFVSFRGVKVSYETKGKGRALVLIHGFLGAKEVWSDYIQRLSKDFRVVAIDLLGHGASECHGYLHSMELLADSLKAVLKALDIRKAVVVGHSLGGYVGLAFAEKYPDMVLGMVLMNSTAKGDSAKRIKSRNQLIKLVQQDRKKAVDLLVPTFFNIKKRNTHWQIKRYQKIADQCSERAIIATVEGMKIRKEREIVLKFAPFPYLLLLGKQDSILEVSATLKEAELGERGYAMVLEDSSHMCLFEEVEKTYKTLRLFAKQLKI